MRSLLLSKGSGFIRSITAALVICRAGVAVAQPSTAPATYPETAVATSENDLHRQQINVFTETLLGPADGVSEKARQDAVRLLLNLHAEQATGVLKDALQREREEVAKAIINVLSQQQDIDPELLPSLIHVLTYSNESDNSLLHSLLVRCGRRAHDALTATALDRNLPAHARIAAINALVEFRTRQAIGLLVNLCDHDPPEPEEIVGAGTSALERLTGFEFGHHPKVWRDWWTLHEHDQDKAWLRMLVDQLGRRARALESQLADQQAEQDAVANRLAETMRDLFLTMTLEEQISRLPALLDDPLAPVRQFAIYRVERLRRDSERVPADVQDKLIERLMDDSEQPDIRHSAAQLLAGLRHPQTSSMIAQILNTTTNRTHIRGYLGILQSMPTIEALDAILRWYCDKDFNMPAADALWKLVSRPGMTPEQLDRVRSIMNCPIATNPSAEQARLLAAIGSDAQAVSVQKWLDHESAEARRTVAMGFAFRGDLDVLATRAGDDTVYLVLIDAWSQTHRGLSGFHRIRQMPPPSDAVVEEWRRAMIRSAGALDTNGLYTAANSMPTETNADLSLARELFTLLLSRPAEDIEPAMRQDAAADLARISLDMNDPAHAATVLENLQDDELTEESRLVRLTALLWSGRFDQAAVVDQQVNTWINVLADLVARDKAAAESLRDEIARRFGPLEGELKQAFDDASHAILGDTQTPGTEQTTKANEPTT